MTRPPWDPRVTGELRDAFALAMGSSAPTTTVKEDQVHTTPPPPNKRVRITLPPFEGTTDEDGDLETEIGLLGSSSGDGAFWPEGATWEALPEPEPVWQRGDVAQSSERGQVMHNGRNWRDADGIDWNDGACGALTLLLRDGKPVVQP